MGGIRDKFLSTHWSLVEGVKEQGGREQALLDLLIQRYWKPVYCYLRRKGYPNEKAKDLTQGFFHEVVLNRQLVERADPALGSFRSLLLHALSHYLIDEHRKEGTKKRIPKDKMVRLDTKDTEIMTESMQAFDPEESFNYAWRVDMKEKSIRVISLAAQQLMPFENLPPLPHGDQISSLPGRMLEKPSLSLAEGSASGVLLTQNPQRTHLYV